jgi:hypothetical protein
VKPGIILGAAAIAAASLAPNALAAGINLSWNDCGTFGTQNMTFDCLTNSGAPFSAVASFFPPAGVNNFLGISSQIDIFTDQANLPDWWKHGTGQCRGTTGLSISFDFTIGPFSCFDFYSGQAAGGSAYDSGFGSPARGRLRVQAAVPFDNRGPVSATTEYYAYKANFTRAKTTGTGSCTGCSASACIVLNDIQLFQPPDALNDPQISNPADRNYVTFQAPAGGPPGCPLATPARSRSWGQVKSLYR